jgi:uncharacterized membrane protein
MPEEILKQLTDDIALLAEATAAVFVAYGAVEALVKVFGHVFHRRPAVAWRKELFVGLGVWLLLALQFGVAADIVRSLIAPTWQDIGQLAALAAIRTFLNYFLERDLDQASKPEPL